MARRNSQLMIKGAQPAPLFSGRSVVMTVRNSRTAMGPALASSQRLDDEQRTPPTRCSESAAHCHHPLYLIGGNVLGDNEFGLPSTMMTFRVIDG